MPQTVKGVIARSKGADVELVDIIVPDPGPGEAVVQVRSCGVCHTDLHYRQGGINDEFPFLLGHEAAGVVEAVGEGVTDVAPGDFVILNWRAVCGQCRACAKGKPWYCFATANATQRMTLTDGTELSPALGIGAFAEKRRDLTVPYEVKGAVTRSKGSPSASRRSSSPMPSPGRRWSTCRPAGSAIPVRTTAEGASTTTSRSCSATRPPARSPRSVKASPT